MRSEGPTPLDSTDPAPANGERIKVHDWPAPNLPISTPITDDTPLVPYMKLETYLLISLGDQIFIPTVKLLQQADGSEGLVPFLRGWPNKILSILRQHEEWLLKEAKNHDLTSIADENVRQQYKDALAEQSWRQELAKRRCVSCWNRSAKQIDFMWRIYGDRGVVIYSALFRVVFGGFASRRLTELTGLEPV